MTHSDDMPDTNEEWGVYETACRCCEIRIIVVATVHSVEYGYAEAFADGQPLCTACEAAQKVSVN